MTIFGSRVISLRNELELSQEALGVRVGKSRSTISGYETEDKEPDFGTLCALADLFKVSTDYLLGRTDKRNNVDVVFPGDTQSFKRDYEASPNAVKIEVDRCLDCAYKLFDRDVKAGRTERLSVYSSLFNKLSVLRNQIVTVIGTSGGAAFSSPLATSNLMALQSQLKNDVSALLDQLIQTDMELVFHLEEKSGSSETA
ncbi:MAG: helix-turn-helix transcriptional regulator [Oscillospiraceae bacterium]|nr:helix-turn-helix transcriptional regulator [Oscillospiraceae bacterium]